MTRLKTIKAAIGLCAGLLLSSLGACDTGEPDDSIESSESSEFRCSYGTIPGVGALQQVWVSGTAQIFGAGGDNDFDVFSNELVGVSGSAKIWGNAYATDDTNVNVYNSGSIAGDTEGNPITVPDWIPWNEVNYIWNYRRNNYIGGTSWGRDPTYYYNRKLRVYGGEYLWLAGGYYYFTQLDIADGSQLRIYQDVIIVIDGPMTISDYSSIVTYNGADVLFIGVDNQPIEISNGAGVYNMRLYAPRAPIMISGTNSEFAGGLVGNTLQVSGNSLVEVRDDALHIWNPC